MRMLRMVVCSLVAGAGMLGAGSVASAEGLVGFYVYHDAYGRGLLISSFIPGTSADRLRRQGELYPGDIITRYNGRRVHSAEQIRAISSWAPWGEWHRRRLRRESYVALNPRAARRMDRAALLVV